MKCSESLHLNRIWSFLLFLFFQVNFWNLLSRKPNLPRHQTKREINKYQSWHTWSKTCLKITNKSWLESAKTSKWVFSVQSLLWCQMSFPFTLAFVIDGSVERFGLASYFNVKVLSNVLVNSPRCSRKHCFWWTSRVYGIVLFLLISLSWFNKSLLVIDWVISWLFWAWLINILSQSVRAC